MSDFDIVWSLYKSMDFPALPIEESLKHCKGMHILRAVSRYLLASLIGYYPNSTEAYKSTGALEKFFDD